MQPSWMPVESVRNRSSVRSRLLRALHHQALPATYSTFANAQYSRTDWRVCSTSLRPMIVSALVPLKTHLLLYSDLPR